MSYAQKNKKRDTRLDKQYADKTKKKKVVNKKNKDSKKKNFNYLDRIRGNLQKETILRPKKKSNNVSSKSTEKKLHLI